jgi:hypothetical protein
MWTNQPIYFVLLVLAALSYLVFGIYPVLAILALILVLFLRAKLKGPREWRTPEYAVRLLGTPRDAWVEYTESGRTLALRAEWSGTKGSGELTIWLENSMYLPPDYGNPLSQERVGEIQRRVSEGLTKLSVRPAFVREGWTSVR